MAAHEELLELAGGFGLYQLYCLAFFYVSLVIFYGNEAMMIFGAWIPQTWPSNDTSCGALINNTIVTYGCNEDEVQFYSLVIEWGLVGVKEYIPALLVSLQLAGLGAGPLIFGQLSDNIGRKPIFLATFIPMIIFGVGSSFCQHWQVFGLMRFLIGVFTSAATGVTNIILQECLLPRHRLIYSIGSWPAAGMVVVLLAKLSKDWRLLSVIIQIPAVLFMAAFGISESPKWLLQSGRFDRAKAAYLHIAKMNRKIDVAGKAIEEHFNSVKILNSIESGKTGKRTYMMWDIFYSRKALPTILVVLTGWVVVCIEFYGLFFNVSDLSGDIYLNMVYIMIVSAIAKSSQPFIDWAFPRLGRRGFLLGSLAFIILTIGFAAVASFTDLPVKHPYSLTIPSILGLGVFEIVWTIVVLQTIELFPTEVRNMAFNVGLAVGRVGAILSPQIFLLHHVWAPSPYLVLLGLLLVWYFLAYFFIPETRGRPLPDIHEADTVPLETINGTVVEENGFIL